MSKTGKINTATNRSPFFINKYMIILIVLNIILIIIVIFLTLFLFKNKKKNVKGVCVNNDICGEIEKGKHKQDTKSKSERVFVGKIVTDEEYQQIIKNQRKDSISSLMQEVNIEYERLNKLKNEQ